MSEILLFQHKAMATQFQARLAGVENAYAAQAAQAALALMDDLESRLSRFRPDSEISQIAQLAPGEQLRLSEPVFACLDIARRLEAATRGGFSVTANALKTQATLPQWALLPGESAIRCEGGRLEFDLGAIGKGFALDRLGAVLREWDCRSFMLVAGGSSILAGEAPPGGLGWSCGLGEDRSPRRLLLANCSLSGSGLAVQGRHIFDPRTGLPAARTNRAWALTDTAAESDALSTAAMVLTLPEISAVLAGCERWLVFLAEGDDCPHLGKRPLPPSG